MFSVFYVLYICPLKPPKSRFSIHSTNTLKWRAKVPQTWADLLSTAKPRRCSTREGYDWSSWLQGSSLGISLPADLQSIIRPGPRRSTTTINHCRRSFLTSSRHHLPIKRGWNRGPNSPRMMPLQSLGLPQKVGLTESLSAIDWLCRDWTSFRTPDWVVKSGNAKQRPRV